MRLRAVKFLITSVMALAMILRPPVSAPALAQLSEGKSIPSFPSLKDTDDGTFSSADFNDRFTLLVFFSIYSDGTPELLKHLDKLQKQPGFTDRLQVICVNIDPSRDSAISFIEENAIKTRVILDNNLELSNRFAVRKPPVVLIIGPDKTIKLSESDPGPDKRFSLDDRLLEIMNSKTGAVNNAGEEDLADIDKLFREKKLVGAGATFLKTCPVRGNLLLYVSGDSVLWLYNINDAVRKELATDVGTADWAPKCDAVVYDRKKKTDVWIKRLDEPADQIAAEGRQPAWSPRGDMIAFVVNSEIWVYQITTGKKWQTPVSGKNVQWTLDGALLLVTDQKGRAWLVSPFSRASIIRRIIK